MEAKRWDARTLGPMSEAAVRRLWSTRGRSRVCRFVYDPGTSFVGAMMAGECYVIVGRCRYAFADQEVVINSGEIASLSGGGYAFEVLGEAQVELVLAWDLSREFV